MNTPFELRKAAIDSSLGRTDVSWDTLEKSEGSKGGVIIGYTRSGKPIYNKANHPAHKDYNGEESDDVRFAHYKKNNPKEVAAIKNAAKHYH